MCRAGKSKGYGFVEFVHTHDSVVEVCRLLDGCVLAGPDAGPEGPDASGPGGSDASGPEGSGAGPEGSGAGPEGLGVGPGGCGAVPEGSGAGPGGSDTGPGRDSTAAAAAAPDDQSMDSSTTGQGDGTDSATGEGWYNV